MTSPSAAGSADTFSGPIRRKLVPLSVSHFGFFVHDEQRMEDFYTRVLGFTVTDRGQARGKPIIFVSWDPAEHHQIALVGGRPKTLDFHPIHQISLRVGSLEDLQTTWLRVKDEPGVHDIQTVDHGNAWALYFRDPESNRLEIFCDSEWHVAQPCYTDIDLSRPTDAIRAASEAFCRASPGFMPAAEFRAGLAATIEARLAAENGDG